MKKLIVITGADGSGKSTLIKRLTASFKRWREVSIWDAMDANLFQSKTQIDDYLCSLTPNARALFLAHALMQSLEKAQNTDAKVLVANGYFYKYFASELALGAEVNLIEKLISIFPKPDLVVKLDVDVQTALSRKTKLTQYECGAQPASAANFLAFQEKAANAWTNFDQKNWRLISATNSPEKVYHEVLGEIYRLLK